MWAVPAYRVPDSTRMRGDHVKSNAIMSAVMRIAPMRATVVDRGSSARPIAAPNPGADNDQANPGINHSEKLVFSLTLLSVPRASSALNTALPQLLDRVCCVNQFSSAPHSGGGDAPLEVLIQQLDADLGLPTAAHPGDAGVDLHAATTVR